MKKQKEQKTIRILDATGQLDWTLMENEFYRQSKERLSKAMETT